MWKIKIQWNKRESKSFLTMLKLISGVSQWGSGFNSLRCSPSQGKLLYAHDAGSARSDNLH